MFCIVADLECVRFSHGSVLLGEVMHAQQCHQGSGLSMFCFAAALSVFHGLSVARPELRRLVIESSWLASGHLIFLCEHLHRLEVCPYVYVFVSIHRSAYVYVSCCCPSVSQTICRSNPLLLLVCVIVPSFRAVNIRL